ANPNVSVNLGSVTKTVSKYIYGFATGALADNGWAFMTNAQARASLSTLKPTLIRVNANEGIPRAYATGNTTIMDNFLNNLSCFDPQVRLVMGCGPITPGD